MRTRIKFCGFCNRENALQAAQLGVDAIGLNFHPASPRYVTLNQARDIALALPPFITIVALFLNPSVAMVSEVLKAVNIDALQFHGSEPADFCQQFAKPYLKAVSMQQDQDLNEVAERHEGAQALLLDSHQEDGIGGTGVPFDWHAFQASTSMPLILAGGLNAGNVARGIELIKPYAVDVSSGIESSPGIKSLSLMQEFVNEVKRVDV